MTSRIFNNTKCHETEHAFIVFQYAGFKFGVSFTNKTSDLWKESKRVCSADMPQNMLQNWDSEYTALATIKNSY